MLITTTLNKIKALDFCGDEKDFLVKAQNNVTPDEEFPLWRVLDAAGLTHTLRLLNKTPKLNLLRMRFALACATRVEHLMEDKRSIQCLRIIERFLEGKATKGELKTARDAAWAAARDAARDAAWDAARAAAWAAALDAEKEWQTEKLSEMLHDDSWGK